MIERLDLTAHPVGPLKALENKVNELIDAFNKHYHETLDTHYNTTGPKYEATDDVSN